MVSTSSCAMSDEVDLVGHLSPVIGVGDEEDTVAEFEEWPRLRGSRVEYPTGSSRFREFCKAKNIIDGISVYAFRYRGNFFYTCSVSQGGDYLYLLPDLAKERKYRHLGDEVSLEYVEGVVKDSRAAILICKTLNERWAESGSERRITAKDFLEYYAVKYVTATDGAYLSSSSSRPCFFDLSSAGRVWNDNLLWVSGECLQRSDEEPLELNNKTITKGISCKVSRKEFFIDVVAREGTELKAALKELEISRFKRVASKDDKVVRLNEIPDGLVDMATISNTAVRNLANVDDSSKRRKVTSSTKLQVVLQESDKITEGADLRPRVKVEAGLLEEQCRAKAREKMVVVDDEFKKFARALRGVQLGLQDRSIELEKRIFQLEGEKNYRTIGYRVCYFSELVGKLYQLRYTKVEILAFSEGNYEEKEIIDEVEVEEMEDGRNVAEKTAADNQETIDQEIKSSRLRVVDLEGLLKVEKKSSAELVFVYVHSILRPKLISLSVGQGGIDYLELTGVCTASLSVCFIRSVSQLEEYEALISQYEDQLDGNVKLSLKSEEAKGQVEDVTATILCRALALNQLTSKLAELKEKAASEQVDLAEVQAKNKSLVDDLAYARGNMWRSVQRDKEMNERINQLIARISKLERELRVRELKYEKDLKFKLDKRDGEIASGEGSREMKEFLFAEKKS
ncbi:hypothetical protein GIB67_002163 [Kingdonia uniflora]|uniref:Uncharacterized protein n=1 Tax=Kingdonia uniflora TaxID=39325 RepID=A0A7J7KWS1_9MAGN|nr:hypothetical protein GIB67_002163 [Kingdonia uniflora]